VGSAAASQENRKKEPKEKDPKTSIEQAEAVRLVYHIQEGPQTRVRRILIGGYSTRDRESSIEKCTSR